MELVCLDATTNEVGRFKAADVSVYAIAGLTGENKAIVLRLIDEVVNKKRLHDLPEFFAADVLEHVSVDTTLDLQAVRATYEALHTAFPHALFNVETIVAEGSLVAVRTHATTKHLGPLFGHEATGRQVTIGNIDIYRLDRGKIVEHWGYGNDLGLAQQLGLSPRLMTSASPGEQEAVDREIAGAVSAVAAGDDPISHAT
jgi:predicted ester cyclase